MKYTVYRIPSTTCVLNAPVAVDDGAERLTHYSRSYFVTALTPDDALEVLREDVAADGATLLDAEAPEQSSAAAVPIGRLQRLALERKRGVCWRSGRAFFPAS